MDMLQKMQLQQLIIYFIDQIYHLQEMIKLIQILVQGVILLFHRYKHSMEV